MLPFERLTGAQADVNELLYISALHQTQSSSTRANATVSSLDVTRLLMSRHLINISHNEAVCIVRRLGGVLTSESTQADKITVQKIKKGTGVFATTMKAVVPTEEVEDTEETEEIELESYLDLVQILSLILIPVLAGDPEGSESDVFESSAKSLISQGYKGLLKDLGQDIEAPKSKIDEDYVQSLLVSYGELERASDPALVQEMIRVLGNHEMFTKEAFSSALRQDLSMWTSGVSRNGSHMEEVKNMIAKSESTTSNLDDSHEQDEEPKFVNEKSSSIADGSDFVIDAHASMLMTILTFGFFVLSAVVYLSLLNSALAFSCGGSAIDENAFGCQVRSTLWKSFAIPFVLACIGVVLLAPLNWGNDPNSRKVTPLVVSAASALIFSLIPFFLTDKADVSGTTSQFWTQLKDSQLFVGLGIACLYLLRALIVCVTEWKGADEMLFDVSRFLISSNDNGEVRTKRAAAAKLNNMLQNAAILHHDSPNTQSHNAVQASLSKFPSNSEKAAMNFVLYGNRMEKCGGILDVWRKALNRSLFDTEGIWLPTRFITFQCCQVVLAFGITVALIFTNRSIIDYIERKRDELNEGSVLETAAAKYIPSNTAVNAAVWPATLLTVITMVLLILVYLPSAYATVSLYRCGLIPSLGSPNFNKFRLSVDMIYFNLSNALYGLSGSAGLIYLLGALAIFLVAYHVTQDFMLYVIAWGIGLTLAISAKTVLTTVFRSQTHRAFYRRKPRMANIVSLLMESWTIGVGASVLIGRITQFLLGAVFWVGRTDVHFLADNVTLFGYDFDFVPTNFIKELLVHDAHRHPYIEILAQIYMLQLHSIHSDGMFLSPACSAWRQLLVLSVFPWMRKYRIHSNERLAQAIESVGVRQLEQAKESEGVVQAVGENIEEVGTGVAKVTGKVVQGAVGATALSAHTLTSGAQAASNFTYPAPDS